MPEYAIEALYDGPVLDPAHYYRIHDERGWGWRCEPCGVDEQGFDKLDALKAADGHNRFRHVPTCALSGHDTPVMAPTHKLRVAAGPDGPQFEIPVCDDHYATISAGVVDGMSIGEP